MSKSARLLPRVLLSVGALVLSLLGAEAALRLGGWSGQAALTGSLSEIPPELYAHDQRLVRRHAPNQSVVYTTAESHTTIRTNDLGLRGPARDPSASGVLCLGDSFTFGAEVDEEQTSCARLAEALAAQTGAAWQPLNAGVSAYSVWQSVELFRELAPKLKPKVAVLNVYYGNDLVDNARFKERSGQAAAPGYQAEGAEQARAQQARATLLARYIRLGAFVLALRAQRSPDPGMQAMLQDELRPFVSASELNALMPHTRTALGAFRRVCQERRITCAISLIPPAWVVYPRRAQSTAAVAGLSADALDAPRVVSALVAAAPDGLPVVDLTPRLLSEADSALLYFRFDPHWTPAGHQINADAQAEALRSAGVP